MISLTQPTYTLSYPRSGVSIAVFRGDEVLLVERGRGAMRGRWTLPGGHVEAGERVRDAALRELREETGVDADLVGVADVHDVLLHAPDGGLDAHYVLSVFYARWRGGEPVAASDAAAARFVGVDRLNQYALTDGAADIIGRAWALLGRPGP